MKKLVEFIVKNIVDDESSVKVVAEEQEGVKIIKLTVGKEDRGKIIGKNGKVIRSIRTLVKIKSIKAKQKTFLELLPSE